MPVPTHLFEGFLLLAKQLVRDSEFRWVLSWILDRYEWRYSLQNYSVVINRLVDTLQNCKFLFGHQLALFPYEIASFSKLLT